MNDDSHPPNNPSTTTYDELKWHSAPPLDAKDGDAVESPSSPPRYSSNHDPASPPPPSPSQSAADTVIPTLRTETTALLVVDVQPEYWSQCAPVRRDFPDFPTKLQATVDICRQKTAAKIIWVRADYRYSHSPWLKQFARIHGLLPGADKSSNTSTTDFASDNNNNNDKEGHPTNFRVEVPCDPTSKDFQWEDFATPKGGDVIIPKSSWSSTSNTALMDILRVANVDTVLVCGLITSVCVQHSAFGIFEAGYRTILVTDACADRGRARHDAALALYGDYMYELITSDHLRSGLQKAKPVWALMNNQQQQDHHVYSPTMMLSQQDELMKMMSPSSLSLSTTPLSTSTSTSSLSSASFAAAEAVVVDASNKSSNTSNTDEEPMDETGEYSLHSMT